MACEKAPKFKDLHLFWSNESKKFVFLYCCCMLVGKKGEPQYKNNGKTKVLKAYNSLIKGDRHKVSI